MMHDAWLTAAAAVRFCCKCGGDGWCHASSRSGVQSFGGPIKVTPFLRIDLHIDAPVACSAKQGPISRDGHGVHVEISAMGDGAVMVKVKFFASGRELAGTSEATVAVPAGEATTAAVVQVGPHQAPPCAVML